MISYFPVVTGSLSVSGSVNISGGITASGGITISGSIDSASYAATASFVALAQSASNAITASSADNFLVRNTLTAQTLVVQTITSSVDFVTGSTRFGSILGNTHVFSGSVSMNPNGLFVSGSGLVGIGTTPSIKLSVRAADAPTAPTLGISSGHFIIGNGASTISYGLMFGVNGDGHSWIQSQRVDGAATAYNILLNPQGGNVGIGTTTPASFAQLHLNKAGNTGMFISNTTGNCGGYLFAGGLSGLELQSVDSGNTDARKLMLQPYGGNVLIGTSTDNGNKLQVNGNSYLGTGFVTSNSLNATGGQYGNAVSAEYGATTWAVNLSTLFPNVTISGRGLSIILQILGLSDGSNGSSVLVNAYRSIGGTWVINTVNSALNGTTFINSVTGSGATITINWNTTAFGCVNVSIINRG
jgi:hypothetical protein